MHIFSITKILACFAIFVTAGYSGSDMKNLVKDATMGPLREALKRGIDITNLTKDDMRLVTLQVTHKSEDVDYIIIFWVRFNWMLC